jgi:hypothetical protein
MLLNEVKGFADLPPRQAGVLRQLNSRLKPELGLAVLALNMHMHPRLLSREEVKAKATLAENCWTHRQNDTR